MTHKFLLQYFTPHSSHRTGCCPNRSMVKTMIRRERGNKSNCNDNQQSLERNLLSSRFPRLNSCYNARCILTLLKTSPRHVNSIHLFLSSVYVFNKSGKLSQDTPVLPQVVKLGHAPDKIQV